MAHSAELFRLEADRLEMLSDLEKLADQMTALAVRHKKASEEFHALTIVNSAAIVRMAFENLQAALKQPVPERTDWSKKVGAA
jgi:hypothetical protein